MSAIDGNITAVTLIPGPGGAYTSTAIITATTGAETIAVPQCSGIEIQQILTGASSLSGTFALEETLNGTSWSPFGSAVSIANGQISKFEAANRPMNRLRINAANVVGLDATHYLQLKFQGHAIGSGLT